MTQEEEAILGDRAAACRVVSALRKYRAAAQALLSKCYQDGFCDGCATSTFQSECEDAELDLTPEDY